jgi:hypothetical protein
MKQIAFLPIFFSFLSFNSNSQITKNNWLLSGNASFATQKNSSTATLQYKQTDFQISPTIGYFIIDKFAAGLRPSFTYGKNNLVANAKPQTIFSIGPFVRYYFLQTDRPFNLLAEGTYAHATFNQASESKQHTFSFSAGPVLYFNTTVGLEFTIGYSTTKVTGFTGSNNAIRFGIGFQFHLEKEK